MNLPSFKNVLIATLIACAPLAATAKSRAFLNFYIDVVDYGYGSERNRLVGEIDYLLRAIDREMDRFVTKFSYVHDYQLRDTQVVIQDIGRNWNRFVLDSQARFGIHAADLYAMRDALSDVLYEMERTPSKWGTFDRKLNTMHNFYMDAITAMDTAMYPGRFVGSWWRMTESFNRVAGIIRSI